MIRAVDMRLANKDRAPEYRWFTRMVHRDNSPASSWSAHFWHYWIVVTFPKIRNSK